MSRTEESSSWKGTVVSNNEKSAIGWGERLQERACLGYVCALVESALTGIGGGQEL